MCKICLGLIDVINDKNCIKKPEFNFSDYCLEVINKMSFKETSQIFGRERDQGLESVIRNVYQEFGGQALYPSIEEKACNFLYFIVKDHIFVDGNKRIGATLFLYFLNFYGILRREGCSYRFINEHIGWNVEIHIMQEKLDQAYNQIKEMATKTVEATGGVKILENNGNYAKA